MDEREMLFGDPKTASIFYQIIDERIRLALKDLKYNSSHSATIMAVGSEVADIRIQGATNTITNVKNKTGNTLVVGDEVVIEAINGSMNNLVIKYKK